MSIQGTFLLIILSTNSLPSPSFDSASFCGKIFFFLLFVFPSKNLEILALAKMRLSWNSPPLSFFDVLFSFKKFAPFCVNLFPFFLMFCYFLFLCWQLSRYLVPLWVKGWIKDQKSKNKETKMYRERKELNKKKKER